MLGIIIAPEVHGKLRKLIEEEDEYEQPFVRIREVKVGGGWTSHNELRLSISERDEYEDDELEGVSGGIPFILHPDIVSSYGTRYTITLDEDGVVVVTSLQEVESKQRSLFRTKVSRCGC